MKVKLTERQLRQIIREELEQNPKITNVSFVKIVDVEESAQRGVGREATVLMPEGLFKIETSIDKSMGVVFRLDSPIDLAYAWETNDLDSFGLDISDSNKADEIHEKMIPDELGWEWFDLAEQVISEPMFEKQREQFLSAALEALKEFIDTHYQHHLAGYSAVW